MLTNTFDTINDYLKNKFNIKTNNTDIAVNLKPKDKEIFECCTNFLITSILIY